MTPRAILFDMDGVLVDAAPLRLRAIQLALGARGSSYTERDSRAFADAPDPDVLRVLRILFDLDTPTSDLVEVMRGHLVRLIGNEGRPLPGVPAVPRHLRRQGARLGLVTSAARSVVGAVLGAVGLADAFETVVSGEEVARVKPAPDALIMAARRLAVRPEECLVVEDSRAGVLGARAAGMPVAAVPGPGTSDEDFTPADLVLPSLWALPKALGWNSEDLEGMVVR
jgi:HAD superfamily hydrolase (TIGR01509 family)